MAGIGAGRNTEHVVFVAPHGFRQTTYKKQFLFWLFLSSVAITSAQKAGLSPAATEKMKMTWVWNQSSNAAGLKLDPSKNYATLSGGYTLQNGNYHRVMEGDKNKNFTLNTESGVNIRDFYFWGTIRLCTKCGQGRAV